MQGDPNQQRTFTLFNYTLEGGVQGGGGGYYPSSYGVRPFQYLPGSSSTIYKGAKASEAGWVTPTTRESMSGGVKRRILMSGVSVDRKLPQGALKEGENSQRNRATSP